MSSFFYSFRLKCAFQYFILGLFDNFVGEFKIAFHDNKLEYYSGKIKNQEHYMAYFFDEPSHTFDEYLLIPGYTSADCVPANVSLRTPIVRYNKK